MKIYQADAFTDRPFAGNPAAVCLLDAPKESSWMQALAMEMNLSETAFLERKGHNHYHLRWFTPNQEVDLCGHATLASAHVLWEKGFADSRESLQFDTLSGPLGAIKDGDWIELDFPSEPAQEIPFPARIAQALGGNFRWAGQNRMDYLFEMATEEEVLALEPDFRFLSGIPCRGFLVTAKSENQEYDFVSRCFFPAFAVDEDPVTGSAHCCLGPYWAEKLAKKVVTGYQASRRGGKVQVSIRRARVGLRGQAVTVFEGNLTPPAR